MFSSESALIMNCLLKQVSESLALGDVAQSQSLPVEELAARKPMDAEELQKAYETIDKILHRPIDTTRNYSEILSAWEAGLRDARNALDELSKCRSSDFRDKLFEFRPGPDAGILAEKLELTALECAYCTICAIAELSLNQRFDMAIGNFDVNKFHEDQKIVQRIEKELETRFKLFKDKLAKFNT